MEATSRLLVLPILLAGILTLLVHQTKAEARFSPNNPDDVEELEEILIHEDEDNDEEGEINLEEEVFGTKVKRFAGINIINEDLEAVIVDPSEHVLRALSSPEEKNNALTLEKVKAMYKEQQEKDAKEANARNTRDIASLNFEEMMKRESQAKYQEEAEVEEEQEEGGFFKKMVNLFW